ncbi:alanine--tRNA ligase, mitochondrial isoform X3 [Phyllopteryx taeniolatus]|uniref:alanine--tRNA ligase, mitochondrial isoform X3 n=1 Tax=Phyllopteryx taeniolatus TaxID=161469 RepID=UPI002AD49F8C|nr:alanine--tRNA ligase, mitochondrial isoform X3 [Phyllopteryx taeniolatus]
MISLLGRSLGSVRRLSGPPVRSVAPDTPRPPEASAARVRKTFVDFFEREHGHLLVPSSPVRPRGDPSLLFVNAGMNQFKPILLGTADPRGAMASYRRVVNSQKCVRAGGKHNDLDDVGKDVYHHTFFEMMGNWSFGDYFKEEACAMAWTLLTERFGIASDRLYVSYFAGDAASGLGADEETRRIWLDIGVPPARLLPFGPKENFWEMGDTGPCGPCAEIHYDRVGGRDAAGLVNKGCPDVLEIWNLVFMQYSRLVLRRILRRAVRFCTEVLRAPQGTLASLVPYVARSLGDVYPELRREADRVMDVIDENEDHFLSSLLKGSRLIRRTLDTTDAQRGRFPASVACSLHRDLGFPLDLVDMMLEEKGVSVDRQEVERLIASQHKATSERAGAGGHVAMGAVVLAELRRGGVAYTDDSAKYEYAVERERYVFPPCQARVLALFDGTALVSQVAPGQRCGVILDRTSFYAEQGGQDADRGYFVRADLQEVPFSVEGVLTAGGYVIHQVTATDTLETGDQVHLHLDQTHRVACMTNHTATHLLNFALRKVLGPSVRQRGTHVSAQRLRFDFSVKASLSASELQQVETCVKAAVVNNQAVHVQEVPLQAAIKIAGVRTVDEAYPDPVRVVSVSVPVSELLDHPAVERTSVELCCGTHLVQTASIGDLVIVSERQLVKGISRVVAVTGTDATLAREAGQSLLEEVETLSARMTGSAPSCLDSAQSLAKEVGVVSDAVDNTPIPQWLRGELQVRLKALQRQSNTLVRKLETAQASLTAQALLAKTKQEVVLVDCVEAPSLSVLMKTVNHLSAARPNAHIMLLARQRNSGKILCACQVPKDSAAALSASDWATAVCQRTGGDGGGSAVVARGTGTGADVAEALAWAEMFARNSLATFMLQLRDRVPIQTGSVGAKPVSVD